MHVLQRVWEAHIYQKSALLMSRARASLPGQAPVQLPGAMPLAQNLPQRFAGLQQQTQQPNLAHLNHFLPQQQARPQVCHACRSWQNLACWHGLLLHEHIADPAVYAEVIRANNPKLDSLE